MSLSKQDEFILQRPHLFGRLLGFDKLTEIHSEWIKRWLTAISDLSHMAFRGSYKTTCLVVFVCMKLLQNPELTILFMRKEHTSACAVVDQIRKLFESEVMEYFFGLVHGTEGSLASNTWSKHRITLNIRKGTQKEGNVDAGGIEVKTGDHYHIIIFDDGITRKDARSAAERRITADAIHELTRIRNPGGFILYNGTMWHRNDGWSLKAVPEPKKYPLGSFPFPEFSREYRKELKRTMPLSEFCGQFMLKYVPNERLDFSSPKFASAPRTPEGALMGVWVFALDPAYDGECTTALVGCRECESRIYAVMKVWDSHVSDVYDEILDFMTLFVVEKMINETNADKGMSADDLEMRRAERGESFHYYIEKKHESMDKHARISGRLKKAWRKLFFDPDLCDDDAVDQVKEYCRGAEPCDAPDALASVLGDLPDASDQEYSGGNYV